MEPLGLSLLAHTRTPASSNSSSSGSGSASGGDADKDGPSSHPIDVEDYEREGWVGLEAEGARVHLTPAPSGELVLVCVCVYVCVSVGGLGGPGGRRGACAPHAVR